MVGNKNSEYIELDWIKHAVQTTILNNMLRIYYLKIIEGRWEWFIIILIRSVDSGQATNGLETKISRTFLYF